MANKGGNASGAGALLGLLAGFIILYFLLIPPDVREDYLGINKTAEGKNAVGEKQDANTLLLEKPGTVSEQEKGEYEHSLNPSSLFTFSEDAVLKDAGSFYVESSKTSKKTKEIIFLVSDPENTENVKLSFNAASHNSRLAIELNSAEIFNSEASGFVQVAVENAKKENLLKFYSPDTSWFNLFGRNYYELKDVKVTATVEDVSNRESLQAFFISSPEYKGIEEAYLRYFVECRPSNIGMLDTYINDVRLSSKVPDCGSSVKIAIDPDYLVQGTNKARFSAEKGSFLIDQAAVKTKMKEASFPTYYFEINSTQWNWIEGNEKDVVLSIKFAGVGSTKKAELDINGHKTMVDTDELSYTKTVNKNHLREDNNYIRIIPDGVVEIVELRIIIK